MINIAVNGVCGRMGLRIATLVAEDKDLKLVAALEMKGHQHIGKDLSSIISRGHNDVIISEELDSSADVLIDFTSPDSTMDRLQDCADKEFSFCLLHFVHIVHGVFGFHSRKYRTIAESVKQLHFHACFSKGVNILKALKKGAKNDRYF